MEFINTDFGVSFSLPERVTVRQQLGYISEAGLARGRDLFERYWYGARNLVQNWQCELIPDPMILDLDKATDPKIAMIVTWVGIEVKGYMDRLDTLPKN